MSNALERDRTRSNALDTNLQRKKLQHNEQGTWERQKEKLCAHHQLARKKLQHEGQDPDGQCDFRAMCKDEQSKRAARQTRARLKGNLLVRGTDGSRATRGGDPPAQ
jgi:hypothetical protein